MGIFKTIRIKIPKDEKLNVEELYKISNLDDSDKIVAIDGRNFDSISNGIVNQMLEEKLNDQLTLVIAREPLLEFVIPIDQSLGMQLETDVDTGKHIIFDVEPELAAGKAGIVDGDEIIKLGDTKVTKFEHEKVVNLIRKSIGDSTKLKLKVRRNQRSVGEINL